MRTQCTPLSTVLVVDPYPSSMDGAPQDNGTGTESSNSGSQDSNTDNSTDETPIFGGFGLDD
jgi:hypothetical protein